MYQQLNFKNMQKMKFKFFFSCSFSAFYGSKLRFMQRR